MAKLSYANGVTSVILRVKIQDSASTTGAGKTGLTEASAGMVIGTIADNEAATTRYRASSSEIETIATLGTFAAPTASKCRFKEVDATNHPGLYEIQIADARWAVSNARSVIVTVSGATGAVQVDAEVQLDAVPADNRRWLGATIPAPDTAGYPKVTVKSGTGAGEISLTAGKPAVTLDAADVSGNLPIADSSGVTTLLSRLTAARGGYLDNLNIGGPAASQNDILVLNQSASRRLLLQTVSQYERPESGSVTYTVEARTYDGDGAAVNADTPPTLTATGIVSGSLAANLSAASIPSTGRYTWTYTVSSAAAREQIAFDVSATIAASTFTLACYTQVVDFVAATWTTTDAANLTFIFNRMPASGSIPDTTFYPANFTNAVISVAGGFAPDWALLQNASAVQDMQGTSILSCSEASVTGVEPGAIDYTTFHPNTGLRPLANGNLAAVTANTATLDSGAIASANRYVGCWIQTYIATQVMSAPRRIVAYSEFRVCTVEPPWEPLPAVGHFYVVTANQSPVPTEMNRQSDHIHRRNLANIKASVDGDTLDLLSHYGFLNMAFRSTVVATTQTVYDVNGIALGSFTLTYDLDGQITSIVPN